MKIVAGNKTVVIAELCTMPQYRHFFPNTVPACLCSVNFVDGKPVGGQRITAEQAATLVAKAKESGFIVEE